MAWKLPFGGKQDPEATTAQRDRRRTRQAVVLLCVGVAALVGLGVAGWQMLTSPGSDGEGSLQVLASEALETANEMGTVIRENVTRDASRLAAFLTGSDEDDTTDETEAAEADARTNAPVNVEPPSPARPRARRAPPDLPPVPSVTAGTSVIAAAPTLPPLPGLFDAETPGVSPPGTENIRLHSLDTEGVPVAKTSLVEVIVSPYGEVERAKFITNPDDIHEAMILSAIKAWQFTPAHKDGHPVRYRLVLPVDVALSGRVLVTRKPVVAPEVP